MPPRASAEVRDYLVRLDRPIKPLFQAVRRVVLAAAPEAEESIKWGMPCYSQNGLVCYLKPAAGTVTVGFYRGSELANGGARLAGRGKGVRRVTVKDASHLRRLPLGSWVKEAVRLNDQG